MQEYVTKAVVLDKATRGGHADARYYFFTERYGKIAAKATSSRKIVSKLAGHLEPGTVAAVRIIEQHGTQVIDALKITKLDIPLRDLSSLNNLLGEWEPDAELWNEFRNVAARSNRRAAQSENQFNSPLFWSRTLAILGWDPSGAVCASCGRNDARRFSIPRQEFFCAQCARVNNQLILI